MIQRFETWLDEPADWRIYVSVALVIVNAILLGILVSG